MAVLLSAYGSSTTVLSTELNSLGNGSLSAAGSAYDNSSNLYVMCAVELNLIVQLSARSAGATVTLFMSSSATGTAQDLTVESPLATVFALDAATTARVHTLHADIWLTPSSSIKFALLNSTGQTMGALLNTVKVTPYTMTVA